MDRQAEQEYVEFVRSRLHRLNRTAYLMCGNGHQADDLVQTTLVAVYTRWKQVSAADNIDAFVHRILARRFIDERRSRWARISLGHPMRDLPTPADTSVDERDAVSTALRRLPKGQRAVLVLRFYVDMSVEATAQALGCSEGNVKSQCSRGLAALRVALDSQHSRLQGDYR
jgi:RNA polymerase sigma-70 factor (sigma-E family)